MSGFKGLQLYNTLTKTKEDFIPEDETNVRMYVCGPTVYDFAHIGNARPVIVFDVLFRLLRHLYGEEHVAYARNITDVDDKINKRAAEEGISIRELTETTARQFHEDVAALGCLEPTVEPRATEHIPEMIAMMKVLIEKGHAYAAEGHVLFHTPSMPDYGKLARRSLDEMKAGARVEVAPYKKDPTDFVLWKPSTGDEPGWESPWGRGRPGWHLECSAMSEKHLGKTFDIHGGGIDLVFPHHENEVAQSRCAHGTDVMARYWMHNGFLMVEGEKMSKSLGNFITIHDLLTTETFGDYAWPGQVIRYAMLMTHYRQPIDWTVSKLEEASTDLNHFKTFADPDEEDDTPTPEFLAALCGDLNTPAAIAELRTLLAAARGEAHSVAEKAARPGGHTLDFDAPSASKSLARNLRFLGVKLEKHDVNWVQKQARARRQIDESNIKRLADARLEARKQKNWAEADRIRDELAGKGILLKDVKDPETGELRTEWEVAR